MDFRILVTVLAAAMYACSSDSKSNRSGAEDAAGPLPDTTVVTDDVEGGSLPGIDWSLVKFDFVSPSDPEDISGNSVAVEVAHNLPPVATWSLFYNKSFKSTEGGFAVAENQKADVKSLSWDISTLEPGNYFLFAVIKYGDVQNIRFLSSAIPVEDSIGDNRTPFMSLITNINAQVRAPGAQQTLQFIGVDPDGDDVTYGLEYSADDGTTWVSVFKDLAPDATVFTPDPVVGGQLSYAWTIPASLTRGARYRLRLTGKDDAGKTGEAVTEKFGIAAAQVTFNSEMRALFAGKCVSCHGIGTKATPDSNLRLDYFDQPVRGTEMIENNTNNAANNRRDRVVMRTVDNTDPAMQMPPGGGLTQAELDLVRLWQWGNYGAGLGQPDASFQTDSATIPELVAFDINYTITDSDTPDPDVLFQYRLNNTGNYTTVAGCSGVQAVGARTCSWTPPDITPVAPATTVTATIRIIVDDRSGRQRNNDTRNFTISDVPPVP